MSQPIPTNPAAVSVKGETIGLRNLAEMASVDISTVSRALNNDPRVSKKRANQIRKLAEEMGYRPRPIRGKFTRSIGLLAVSTDPTRNLNTEFLQRIAWATERLLAERNFHVNLECVERSDEAKLPTIVAHNRVDGVLLAGHPSVNLVQNIIALNMPAVAINDSIERLQIACVRSNPEPAIRQAVLHLAARGHVTFGMLLSSLEFPTTQARYRSCCEALQELGIQPEPAWLVSPLPGPASAEIIGGRNAIRELQQRGPIPTAILCENDWIALGAMQELQHLGLRIPQDVSLVGHDDVWICDQLDPRLTSIHRAEDQLVAQAVDLLIEQITQDVTPAPREILVEGEMVWRDSCGPVPGRLSLP